MKNHLRRALYDVNATPEHRSCAIHPTSFIARWFLCLCALSVAATQTTYAHPGHSLTEHGFMHVASSPYHLFVLAGVSAALWGAAYLARQTRTRLFLQIGAAAFAMAAIVWNWLG